MPLFVLGIITSAGAFVLCVLLLLASTAALRLPGCGDASPCDQASQSIWGKVPGLGASVAGVGLSYFLGVGIAWVLRRGRFGAGLRGIVSLGTLVSAMYIVVMLIEKLLCGYCLASHVLHFGFAACVWIASVRGGRTKAAVPTWAGAGPALAVSALCFAIAFGIESSVQTKARATSERALAASVEAMRADKEGASGVQAAQPAQAQQTSTAGAEQALTLPGEQATAANPETTSTGTTSTGTATTPPPTALTGRHIWGGPEASVRIVMFTDYQCPDCKLLEAQLLRLMQTPGLKDDLAVAVRHFPISTVCNPTVTQNRHPDACYGAYASETAGLLGGRDAFWQLHTWLFARGGAFTRDALAQQVRAMKLDETVFFRTMESEPIKALIAEDVALAKSMGIAFTPMIFVNGVELRGYTAPDALVRAATALHASKPARQKLGSDVGLTARERALDEFAKSAVRQLPERLTRRTLGPAQSDIRVVLVGDYAEPRTREADSVLRILTRGPGETIAYSYAHFPVNQACNPHVPFTKHDKACVAARLVEATDLLAGPDAFWRAHDWLMQQGTMDALTPQTAMAAAPTFVDPASGVAPLTQEALTNAMAQPWVQEQIGLDAKAALDAGVTSLPAIFINGKLVGAWSVQNENLLLAIVTQERARLAASAPAGTKTP
jgi:protein-disulfide isomerase